jgi:hypothetical protein
MDFRGLSVAVRKTASTSTEAVRLGGTAWLAEGEGFEPSIRLTTDNGFRDRRIRPLCHPSGVRLRRETEKEGFEPSKEVITPLTP